MPGSVRRDIQPTQVFMAFAGGVGTNKSPEKVRRQMMADQDLLTVDDIIIAVADRLGQAVGDIAAALRFRKHLPYRQFAAHHRRQKLGFLLLGAELHQSRRHQARQGIENRSQRQAVTVDLGFENELVIETHTAAAKFLRVGREKPPFSAQLARQGAAKFILFVVFPGRPVTRPAQMLATLHIFRQPGAHRLTKRANLPAIRL